MALKKKVFLISEGKVVLPFDLGGVDHTEYKRDSLAKTLSEPLKTKFERFAQNLLNVQIKPIGPSDGRGIGDEAEGLRREIARLSQVSDRQNAAVEQLRDLIATMMPSFSDKRTDDSHKFKPSLVAPSSEAIQALAGAWFNEESGSYAYMDVIDGRAVAAYCYQGDTELSGYYFDWQVLKEWHFARFTWVSSPGIHGFSFLRPIDHDRLIGAWWYDDDVEDDPRRNLPDLSTGYASTWVRQPKKAFPRWATSFLNDVRKGGLPV
jgi:hypothetical protein